MFERLGRVVRAMKKAMGPGSYVLVGEKILCHHCGHDKFEEGSALLNTAGLTFLNLDWANKSATILVCKQCGRLEWFIERPEKLER
ncbi:MAG: hypothetical protein V1799_19660 [bacterium]